ncbi:hypothetical protein KRP22_005367 [Phytophthora ramorum]|uniref:uncharacterized protein n=1 Tax=Phytophthora ramorum TaxID=164328 RepID=UPI0030987248|nr:hypothetical protein KRP23_3262 [Phytophthora ramorum]KAH7508417.1 hypothetical protein KRP22_3502 [Phytophthora ramorum]
MEGLVLVEMSSGSLHYTKSFSDAFDVRHPKTERLNLGALIFALQNFAGSSIRPNDSTHPNDNADSTKEQRSGVGAEIGMFATPMENMVLATTPSNKLLVVLFTTPMFDVDVAKWLVGRVAFNYENCDNAEIQLMSALNQVPRQFRLAFSQAVDETVERELIRLSESIFLSSERKREECAVMPGDGELFLFFYYSARLDDSTGTDSDIEAGKRVGSAVVVDPDNRQEECRKPVRAAHPTLADMSSRGTKSASLRNMMSSTRANATTPVKRDNNKKKKPRKQKTPWGAKNAVMHHTEPQEFQRVIEVHSREKKAALMEPHRTGLAYGIADVLLPFVELSGLFVTASATLPKSQGTLQQPQKLFQLVWNNTPGVVSSQQAGTNMVAWRSGPCCIFYPATAVSMNPENKPQRNITL